MKLLRGILQPSGYRVSRLVDPEDLDLLRFEDTGELPEGLDFAIWWKGVWREGRCYDSFPGRMFVTYGDAQRMPLRAGTQTRRPNYTLEPERLLELACTYAGELGYTVTQPGVIIDVNTPATTHSGILDSMGMAHMIGEGAEALSHIGSRFPLMPEDHIVLFGFDPLEVAPWQWEALEQHQMLRFLVTRFNGQPTEVARKALGQLEQRADVVLVHFDVDAIDSADFPLTDFPHHNEGQSLSEALACLSIFCASPKCGGLVLTEVNPDHDGDGAMVLTFTRLLVKTLTDAG